jgi:hypothetical protein
MTRCNSFLSVISLVSCFFSGSSRAQTWEAVTLTFEPSIPLIEHRDGRQLLNFDLAVANHGIHRLRLTEIEISVFDSAGKLVIRKAVNSNGLAPGIDAVANPQLRPGDALFPHVHYALLAGAEISRSEGVPAYFTGFRRLLGDKTIDVKLGSLDSGDIVESTVQYPQQERTLKEPL